MNKDFDKYYQAYLKKYSSTTFPKEIKKNETEVNGSKLLLFIPFVFIIVCGYYNNTLSLKITFSQYSRSERRTEFYKIVISGSPTAPTLVFRIFTLVCSHFQGGCRQLPFHHCCTSASLEVFSVSSWRSRQSSHKAGCQAASASGGYSFQTEEWGWGGAAPGKMFLFIRDEVGVWRFHIARARRSER